MRVFLFVIGFTASILLMTFGAFWVFLTISDMFDEYENIFSGSFEYFISILAGAVSVTIGIVVFVRVLSAYKKCKEKKNYEQ